MQFYTIHYVLITFFTHCWWMETESCFSCCSLLEHETRQFLAIKTKLLQLFRETGSQYSVNGVETLSCSLSMYTFLLFSKHSIALLCRVKNTAAWVTLLKCVNVKRTSSSRALILLKVFT